MKRILSFTGAIFAIAVFLSLCVNAQGDCYSWYCVRNKEHKQPRLDKEMSFVEKYNGYYVDKNHGDKAEEKIVYLTFDAGYENGNIEKILDILKEENVPGAFFVLGNLVKTNPSLVKRMVGEGHLVCNHTYSHKNTACCSAEEFKAELVKLEEMYRQYVGEEMSKYYRPPEGRFSLKSMEWANSMGYKTIFWSFAYDDWDNGRQMSNAAAKKKILSNMHNGAVLLLHPTSDTNAAILRDVIKELKSQGYSFGTLDQLTA